MANSSRESLVFLSGKRTPFGAFGGSLKDVLPSDLGVSCSRAALLEAGVDPREIDHVIYGNVLASSADSILIPRHVGLKTGVPVEIAALGINRLCGTGFQVVVEAWHQMLAGDTKIALVGGVENMSMAPYCLRGVRWGTKMGHQQISDTMTESLYDPYAQASMAITAENLADKHQLSREACDAFALASQHEARRALDEGSFKQEIAPYEITDRKGNKVAMDRDEHPKPETTPEALAKLKAVFKKDGGVVTAGNASGIVDGAASLVVATESEAARRGAKPLGRLVAYGIAGCDPGIMGIGPVPAAREALKRAGMTLAQMDLVEVNEAFAPQTLAVQKELGIDPAKLNVDGGAIAIGHPLAASGTRITMHALHALRRRKLKYALVSACIGGGQGIALVVESFPE